MNEYLLFITERLIVPLYLHNKYPQMIYQEHLSLHRARDIGYWHRMAQEIEISVVSSACSRTMEHC